MSLALFWIFSALMLIFGVCVVLLRSPVSSAMSLVMSFLGLAALFVMLDAYFIGIVQVLVYAGAVMVLVLFIVILLDLRGEKIRRINFAAWLGSGLVLGGVVALLVRVIHMVPSFQAQKPELSHPDLSDVKAVGFILFRDPNWLPFQVIGVLLLVATVGVVLLSKRELK